MNNALYLKPNVTFEPLVNDWYAWGYLISPATAAMVTAHLHMRVLESFVRQPDLHRRAAREGAMRGGMFLDHRGDVAEVEELLENTRRRRQPQLAFARAIGELNQILQRHATGKSLASLYELVPEPLRGFVELLYDLRHQASFRLIEPLLYRSELYDDSLQCVRLAVSDGSGRQFVLSSPRFVDDTSVKLEIPFSSSRVDELAQSRRRPITRSAALSLLEHQDGRPADDLIDLFFTADSPRLEPVQRPRDDVRIRYFGHATILIESPQVSVLIDPAVSYADSHEPPRFTLDDLPDRIDFVLLTHNHQDHVMLETLLQIRHKISTIVVPRSSGGSLQDPSLKLMLQELNFPQVCELDEMESIAVEDGHITGLPFLGEHADLAIRSKLAYCVSLRQKNVIVLADSNNLDCRLYQRIKQSIGQVDAMFIGLECDGAPLSWLYGPLYSEPLPRAFDQSRRLNSSDCAAAFDMVRTLEPASVYVYAMGLEPWLDYISSIAYTDDSKPIVESNKLLQSCRDAGIPAERLYLQRELSI